MGQQFTGAMNSLLRKPLAGALAGRASEEHAELRAAVTAAFHHLGQRPGIIQLGTNCRATVLSWTTRPGKVLLDFEPECLAEDVVVGWRGTTLEGKGLPAEKAKRSTEDEP